jgi:two-component system, sensor histidine kinase and response regulator
MKTNKNVHGFKVLIVDDIAKNIQILGNILLGEGYILSYAQNGEQALKLMSATDFDLVLLDIMMPGLSGFDVCETTRQDPKNFDVPIIFLTAKTDKESILKGFQLGAQDYVTKPFSAEELLARVRTHLMLRYQKNQLKKSNETLEQKVEERTLQLSEANKQLKTLEKAKSDFLSIISHELRTPLNGILGLTDILNTSLKSTEHEEYTIYLKEASERLLKFSETAYLITSLNSEGYKLSFTPQKIIYLLESIQEDKATQLEQKNLKIETLVHPKDLQINIDFDLIYRCIDSIVDNSIKFAPAKSKIKIICTSDETSKTIEITDHGPGFSNESSSSLFQYFTSDDITHSEGMGLSLAATKLIMDAHRGQITIKNTDQGGAQVRLSFLE